MEYIHYSFKIRAHPNHFQQKLQKFRRIASFIYRLALPRICSTERRLQLFLDLLMIVVSSRLAVRPHQVAAIP